MAALGFPMAGAGHPLITHPVRSPAVELGGGRLRFLPGGEDGLPWGGAGRFSPGPAEKEARNDNPDRGGRAQEEGAVAGHRSNRGGAAADVGSTAELASVRLPEH
jgi:hypothetical protein